MAIVVGPTQWQFDVFTLPGTAYAGGTSICRSGGVIWIVAPVSTEVSRDWYSRADAATTAEANAACGDWFVPSLGQLQNPGYTCRTYWDSYSSTSYWSNTQHSNATAWCMSFNDGNTYGTNKTLPICVRAFRCVTY